eukprot:SAG31_NODE_28_length_32713_cov_39.100509_11_plen_71_part_00
MNEKKLAVEGSITIYIRYKNYNLVIVDINILTYMHFSVQSNSCTARCSAAYAYAAHSEGRPLKVTAGRHA